MNAILSPNDISISHKISKNDTLLINGLETLINLSDENITDAIFIRGSLRFFAGIKNLSERNKIRLIHEKTYFIFFESPNINIIRKYYKNEGLGIVNFINADREDSVIDGVVFLSRTQFKKLKEMSMVFLANDKLMLQFNFYFIFENTLSISNCLGDNEIYLLVKELEFSLTKNTMFE